MRHFLTYSPSPFYSEGVLDFFLHFRVTGLHHKLQSPAQRKHMFFSSRQSERADSWAGGVPLL